MRPVCGSRGVARCGRRRSSRPCAARCGAARRRGRRGARRRRSRPRRPSAPRGAWSCRRGRRTGRARARRAAGASARETAIAARDCGISRPCSHSGEAKVSNGRVEDQRLGQLGDRVRAAGARPAPRRSIRSVLARSDGLGGLVVGGHQRARAVSAPSASHHSRAIHSGCECLSAACSGVASGSAATSGRASSRAARRSTALTRPAPRGRVGLGQLDRLADRRVRRDRGRGRSAGRPRGAAPRARAGRACGRPAGQALDHVVERGDALDGAEAQLRGQREVARVQPQAPRLAVQRAVGPRVLLEHAAHDRVRARARRGDIGASGLMDGPVSACQPLRGPGRLIGSAPRSAPGLAAARASTEVQIPV